jgi:hypothetical protein
MTMLLLNRRKGPFDLGPAKKGGKPRHWPAGTTLTVDDDEGADLLGYKDIVQVKDGKQVAGPAGLAPVPAGTGVSGKATEPAAAATPAAPGAPAAKK